MLKFQVKTPGKVILHGEHAVVYQKPALAAAIGLSTKLSFRPEPENLSAIIRLDALNTSFEIPLCQFNTFLQSYRSKNPGNELECAVKLLEEVRAELAKQSDATGNNSASSSKQIQEDKAFLAIYYLLAGAMLSSPATNKTLNYGFKVHIDTELNLGAGLGSSASFGTALAAAFLLLAEHFDMQNYREAEQLAKISMWAYESERIMHGTPSGVDNTVCTYGGMVRYVKGQGFQTVQMQRPLDILLVDSHVNRCTADVVANVRHLWETFPKLIDCIWSAIEQLVAEAVPLYESFGNGQDDSQKFVQLERLFQINNDLLKAIGVTHPRLEQIFSITMKRGFYSKLTGAGAGGFAVVLLPENYKSKEVFEKVKVELEAAGFGVQVTTAGGDGLRIEELA